MDRRFRHPGAGGRRTGRAHRGARPRGRRGEGRRVTHAYLGLAGLDVVYMGTGYAILAALGLRSTVGAALRPAGLAFSVGWASFGMVAAIVLPFGAPLGVPVVLAICAFASGLALLLRRVVPVERVTAGAPLVAAGDGSDSDLPVCWPPISPSCAREAFQAKPTRTGTHGLFGFRRPSRSTTSAVSTTAPAGSRTSPTATIHRSAPPSKRRASTSRAARRRRRSSCSTGCWPWRSSARSRHCSRRASGRRSCGRASRRSR